MNVDTLLNNTNLLLPDAIMKGRSAPGMQVLNYKVSNFIGTKTRKVFSAVKSQENPVAYTQILEFNNLDDPEADIVDLDKVKFKCRCSCRNFYFMWGYWDKQNNALSGPSQKKYTRKTLTRPEVNPSHLPGMCKHIIRLLIVMKENKVVKGSSL